MIDNTAKKCSSDEHGDVDATGDSVNSNREIKYDTDDDTSERVPKKTKLSNQDSANDKISTAAGKQSVGHPLLSIDLSSIIQRHPNLLQDYAKFHQAYHSRNYSKTNKKRKKKFIDPKILDVRRTIQLCCRDNDLSLALATFYECMMGNYYDDGKKCQMHNGADANDGEDDAIENEGMGRVYLEAQTLYNLLNLCEGSFGEREKEGRVHVGTPKDGSRKYETNCDQSADNGNKIKEESDEKTLGGANDAVSDAGKDVNTNDKDASCEQNTEKFYPNSNQPSESKRSKTNHHSHPQPNIVHRLHHANQIHTLLSLLGIPCIEPAFTALIRLASRVGHWEKAEAYLHEAEQTDQCKPKLRMYSSLLKGYCEGLEVEVDEDGKHVDTVNIHDNVDAKKMERVPSQEGLIKALVIWKRMYEKSGGPSTGHPQFHDIAKKSAPSQDKNSVSNDCRDKGHKEAAIKNENDDNDISNAVLFGEGIAPKITLTECEYSSILECATALHDVPVAERVLSDLMERVLIPGLSTTETILNWFRAETKRNGDGMDISSSLSSALEHVNLPPREGRSIGQVTNTNGKGWVIYHGCTIDCKSGALALGRKEHDIFSDNNRNGVVDKDDKNGKFRLKPVELSNEEWEAMRHMNRSIVLEGQVEGHVSQFQGGGKGRKRPRDANDGRAYNSNGKNSKGNVYNKCDAIGNDRKAEPNRQPKDHSWRVNEWKRFETFIKNHPPFNAVIDGANVGYFQQNFGGAPKHVDYRQIDWLVRHLLEQPSNENYHIMLFLHERHFSPKLVPRWAYSIIDTWEGNRAPYDRLTLCRTPGGMNDDWFWMQAALLRGGQKDSPSVLAITNDEMRDHHFQMLAQGSFLRWKERHQVHFDFGQYDKSLRRRKVLLKYPMSYSRRIQRLEGKNSSGDAIAIPLPKKGDEGRYVDGVHVADDGAPEEETYVLIQLAE